jgi:hypothetical protein
MKRAQATSVRLLWAFVGACLCITCATPSSLPQDGTASLAPGTASWQQAVNDNSRRHESYDWFMRTADLRATLVTPRLRKAFIEHRNEFHGRFADEQEKELLQLGTADDAVDTATTAGPQAEQEVLVFVAMYVADQKHRDVSASYSIWDVSLERGDARVRPLKMENVRSSPAVRALFPYVDRFDDLYLFRFPLVDKSGSMMLSPGALRLHIRSALADASVAWELQP